MVDISLNRRARFDYEIQETLEAGIELLGAEVKSVKAGRMNLAGSHVIVRDNQAWLLNADVAPYQPNNPSAEYDTKRTRRLLLRKDEIRSLTGKLEEKGFTLIPLRAYAKRGVIKLELGLAKSRKKGDKRELLKSRAVERDLQREI